MIRGYRTLDEASQNKCIEKKLTQAQRQFAWQLKEPVYAEYEALHPGVVDDVSRLDSYIVFWREWIKTCPAWRSDRLGYPDGREQHCGAMAIIIHCDDEGLLLFCPECLYAGEHFVS